MVHQRFAKFDPLVLEFNLLKFSLFTADRDQTVSRRSEPSSCTTLVGEQPNPWNLLQLQDVISRHRGAKRSRRYELSETISLLSPAYLLFVERWFFHSKSPDHYDRPKKIPARYVYLTVKQLYAITLYNKNLFEIALCAPPVLFRRWPPQSNYLSQAVFLWYKN